MPENHEQHDNGDPELERLLRELALRSRIKATAERYQRIIHGQLPVAAPIDSRAADDGPTDEVSNR